MIPSYSPWISNVLNKQHRLFNNYKEHGFQPVDKNRIDVFRNECGLAIQKAKDNYLTSLGSKLIDPNTSQQSLTE